MTPDELVRMLEDARDAIAAQPGYTPHHHLMHPKGRRCIRGLNRRLSRVWLRTLWISGSGS